MSPKRVLISGGGVAGPALAWFLAKTGNRVTVLERAPHVLPYGQNVDIQGSGKEVVTKMGLFEQYQKLNTTEKGTQFIDPRGRPFAPWPLEEGKASPTSPHEILRGDLSKLLYEATKDLPNVKYLFGTTIKSVLSNDEKIVKVELSNGDMHESDLLVAADGQWSKLRKQCFPDEDVKVVDKGMYVVYFTVPRLPSDNDFWNVYQALGSRIISLRPDPHNTIRAMFTRWPRNDAEKQRWESASRADRQTQEDLTRKEFADAGWQAQRLLDAMSDTPDYYFQAVKQIKLAKWSNSRVVCLGDTAWAPTPLTGMGTTLALDGAYILAGELSKLGPDEHPAQAFEAYENILHKWIEGIQDGLPSAIPSAVHTTNTLHRWLFQNFMWALNKIILNDWVASKLPDPGADEDIKLPQYAAFADFDKEGVKPMS